MSDAAMSDAEMTVTLPPRGVEHTSPRHYAQPQRGHGNGAGVPRQRTGAAGPPWQVPSASPVTPPPASTPAGQPTEREAFDPWAADLRCQVVDRMRMMNTHHADNAWLRRHRDPIGPHAIAFLYSEPFSQTRPGFQLRTATRLFLDGDDVADAPRLLFELAEVARTYRHAGGLDPRTQMADKHEPMSPAAAYIGVALSTLDTPAGPWHEIRRTATGPLTIPGRCLLVLTDATMMLIERGRHHELRNFFVYSTHPLDGPWGQSLRQWQLAAQLADLNDPDTADTWHRLIELHHVLAGSHGH